MNPSVTRSDLVEAHTAARPVQSEDHLSTGRASDEQAQTARARRVVLWAVAVTVVVAVLGIAARFQIMLDGLALPLTSNIFLRLYALYELPFLILLLASTLAIGALTVRRRNPQADSATLDSLAAPSGRVLAALATVVFLVTFAATHLVMHGLLFSMDEFSADFQARIFASGTLSSSIPDAWRAVGRAITPLFISYRPAVGEWISGYLPGYALIKTPFVALGVPTLLNPLLAAITVVALARVARQLWPDEGLRPWVAVALLVTSSQFLLTSATGYSMPAHLCLNTIWLWLYLRGDRRSWIAAVAVGVFALGLHNPFPHALFVAPFFIRLLRDGRWRRLGAAVLAYAAAGALWIVWLRFANTADQMAGGGLFSMFAIPRPIIFWVNGLSFSLLFTWQAPVFGVLIVAAMLRARTLTAPLQDLAWGVLLTLAFFLFFPSTQGHGWGHRYAYQVLGSLTLLAATGIEPLRQALGAHRARGILIASLAATMLIQLPLRMLYVERFVRPFAAAHAYITSRPADVVVVRADSVWYGRDLTRNDPFLRGQPVAAKFDMLAPEQRAALERAHPGRVVDVTNADLFRLGMTRRSRFGF